MRITLAQINFNPGNLEDHLDRIKEIVGQHAQSDLVVFPELILHGHPSQVRPEGYLYRHMKCLQKDVSLEIYRHVKACQARVVLGELRRRGDNYYNLATYVDQNGPQSYAKAHVHWSENFLPGSRLKVFSTPVGPLGLTICYDSAFSEVWRVLALAGARLVVNISAVPAHFPVAYMRRRMQGAAVFNQYYVIYVNRPGPVFAGGSAVYDPHGEELLSMGDREDVASLEFDPKMVQAWREEEILFPNRRPLLYRRVASRNKQIIDLRGRERLKVVGL